MGTTRYSLHYQVIAALVLISILAFGWTGRASAGSIRYVKAGATGLHNGTSWTNAFTSLQQALNVAVSGDQIWVAEGTYKPTVKRAISSDGFTCTDPRCVTFTLKSGVAIYGGFAGTETSLSQRKATLYVFTILSGDIGIIGNTSDNAYHVVWDEGVNSTARLDGFEITGGNANIGYPEFGGGGLCNHGGTPILQNLTFTGNRAGNVGGAVYSWHANPTLTNVVFKANFTTSTVDPTAGGALYDDISSPTLTNVTFSGNLVTGSIANNDGGALYNNQGSNPSLNGVTFSGNSAKGGSAGGGAVYNFLGTTPKFTNVTFSGNSSDADGGALYDNNSSPVLNSVTFSNNAASSRGGGVFNDSGSSPTLFRVAFSGNHATTSAGGGMDDENSSSPTVSNVTFGGNTAIVGGGMNNYNNSNPVITGATFAGNSAFDGAGMRNVSSSPALTNVTFSANAAGNFGGGIYNDSSNLSLNNATFSGNSASAAGGPGGAMYNYNGSAPSIQNSIFWGDGGNEFLNNTSNPPSTPSIVDSVVQGGCPSNSNGCANIVTADPKLGPLQNNGGFTATMALGVGSPAIDAGLAGACPVRDQRGVGRPQGRGCDMGAYEVRALSFRSQGTNDGWVLEKAAGSNSGGTFNSINPTLLVGDDALNRRYRSILSFDTSPLPNAATLVLARVQLLQQGIVGNPTGTAGILVADLADPYFGGQLALQIVDWQATASNTSAIPSFALSGSGWYSGKLNSSWLGHIDKLQTTQFRLRLPIENNNGQADYFSFYSGDAAVPLANRPLLWVYYNP